jgi:Lrp/AsnC family transcriptional regulator for asnA, asnC and gidA
MMTKNPIDIYSFWQETLTKYRDYFASQIISVYVGEKIYSKSFLIDEKDDRSNLMIKRGGGVAKYDELDFQILQILALNARTQILEIANKLNTTTATINNRIKRLKESGIIDRFHITINWDSIGYRWFKVDLYLREYGKIHELTKYLEQNPHLAYINITIGYADLELEFIVKNQQQLQEIIDNIQNKFPKLIRNY